MCLIERLDGFIGRRAILRPPRGLNATVAPWRGGSKRVEGLFKTIISCITVIEKSLAGSWHGWVLIRHCGIRKARISVEEEEEWLVNTSEMSLGFLALYMSVAVSFGHS